MSELHTHNQSEQRRRARKKQKRLHNALCISICVLLLAVVLFIIHLLSGVLSKHSLSDSLEELSKPETSGSVSSELPKDTEVKDDYLFSVCLDAGHGGKDVGSDYNMTRFEKDDVLNLTLKVQKNLEAQNVKVVMTRDDDTFLKLSKRCKIANEAKVDYMVSLHRNTGDGYGVESWIYSQASQESIDLATNILNALDNEGIQRNRGIKYGTQKSSDQDYYINANAAMPACIIELGFLTNEADNELFDQYVDQYAQEICDAIIATHTQYAGGETVTDTETTDLTTTTETGAANLASTSHTMNNTQIPNIESLDTTTLNWGQGSNVDDLNRPAGSLDYQQKYGKYNANFIGDTEDKIIYLTFDEGYEYGCTPAILSTLKEKNVKAVFFVTEPYAKEDPELVQQIIDEGHMLGNHSVTHPADGLPSETIDEQKNEVTGNHEYIKENFGGYEMHLFRYPAGKFSEQSLAILNNCNYKSVFWSFAYLDYDVENQPDETESLQKLIDKLHPGAIYLLHAESWTNTNILGSFIDQARAAGYEFALYD